ncbi:tektin-4-like isoform X2 [Sipha flava]|uniref:Tektin n=1 Tax=Sipha flava TaxID=143950 RepID=A0A8B8GP96_9HEMI|nr:tektin-4-like isoform X2 [Sipha flava]XP_025424153.1 tektin-4-like isoform X2 [Sipha flava]
MLLKSTQNRSTTLNYGGFFLQVSHIMDKPLEKQLTMCEMILDDRTRETCNTDQRLSCTRYVRPCDETDEKLRRDSGGYYSFDQWQKHNEKLLNRSVRGYHQSNVVEYNVQRAINTLSASVDKYALDSTNKIAGTARRIDAWRLDVLQALESVRDEIALLLSSKQKLQKAQTALGVIRSISVECLERRSFRLAVDLTLDPGQVELVKEKELIDEIDDLFCRTLCQLKDQLNSNKTIKYRLEENWSNKNQSMKIDTMNLSLNIQSPIIMSHTNVIEDSENACLSVPEWEMAVKNLYEEAKRTMNDSTLLRSIVDDAVLKKSAKRLRDQADAVDIALARFISDTQHVEQALGNDLKQVVQRLGDSENLIGGLLRVITNLEKAKMTAETRLYNRLKRPEDENFKDSAQSSILSEVKSLQEQLDTLNYQLHCARTGHLGLKEARSQLEDEVRVKRKTLWTDTIRCQKVRAFYPSVSALIGH